MTSLGTGQLDEQQPRLGPASAIGWALGLEHGEQQRPAAAESLSAQASAFPHGRGLMYADQDEDEERFPDTSPDAVELETIKLNGEGRDGVAAPPELTERDRLVQGPPSPPETEEKDEAEAAADAPSCCCRYPRLLTAVLVILVVLGLAVCMMGIEGLKRPSADPAAANASDTPQEAHIIDMEVRCPAGQRLYRGRCRRVY